MPYFRFNVDGSISEPPASFDTSKDREFVRLRIERLPSTLVITMTPEQAVAMGRRLMEEGNGNTQAHARRGPRLPGNRR